MALRDGRGDRMGTPRWREPEGSGASRPVGGVCAPYPGMDRWIDSTPSSFPGRPSALPSANVAVRIEAINDAATPLPRQTWQGKGDRALRKRATLQASGRSCRGAGCRRPLERTVGRSCEPGHGSARWRPATRRHRGTWRAPQTAKPGSGKRRRGRSSPRSIPRRSTASGAAGTRRARTFYRAPCTPPAASRLGHRGEERA